MQDFIVINLLNYSVFGFIGPSEWSKSSENVHGAANAGILLPNVCRPFFFIKVFIYFYLPSLIFSASLLAFLSLCFLQMVFVSKHKYFIPDNFFYCILIYTGFLSSMLYIAVRVCFPWSTCPIVQIFIR
jgi:hypothetical protein